MSEFTLHGRPLKVGVDEKIKQRFESKFRVTPGCWIWTAAIRGKGYGCIWCDGMLVGAHRVSYELYVGPVPSGLVLRHTCDFRLCVNPSHLLLGTVADNSQDMIDRGRGVYPKGSRNGQSKLSEEQAIAILSDSRLPRIIASDYGVCRATIMDIKHGITWSHISVPA